MRHRKPPRCNLFDGPWSRGKRGGLSSEHPRDGTAPVTPGGVNKGSELSPKRCQRGAWPWMQSIEAVNRLHSISAPMSNGATRHADAEPGAETLTAKIGRKIGTKGRTPEKAEAMGCSDATLLFSYHMLSHLESRGPMKLSVHLPCRRSRSPRTASPSEVELQAVGGELLFLAGKTQMALSASDPGAGAAVSPVRAAQD